MLLVLRSPQTPTELTKLSPQSSELEEFQREDLSQWMDVQRYTTPRHMYRRTVIRTNTQDYSRLRATRYNAEWCRDLASQRNRETTNHWGTADRSGVQRIFRYAKKFEELSCTKIEGGTNASKVRMQSLELLSRVVDVHGYFLF